MYEYRLHLSYAFGSLFNYHAVHYYYYYVLLFKMFKIVNLHILTLIMSYWGCINEEYAELLLVYYGGYIII